MNQLNCARSGCRDVFHAFLVENAEYEGALEIPCMRLETKVPNALIPFSKAISAHENDQWVHFYEDDSKFERLWREPRRYLPIIKRFNGVISPDFSVYRDMPLVMQQWNTYRGRAIGHWLQEQGVCVIPNIRFGDERSLDFCCAGVPKGGTIAVGTHGCIRQNEDREYFKQGLRHAVKTLVPRTIVVYGTTPADIFAQYRKQGIEIIGIEGNFYIGRKAVSA